MTTAKTRRDGHRQKTFEDLRGLRAEGYIRDSTLDQRDGFGPTIQRHDIERFADSYGLVLGNRWYTEFVSGRQVQKRKEFQRFIEDAHLDAYDVLLVDHTSRFGRNQAECIRYKDELQGLDKVVVFVAPVVIGGGLAPSPVAGRGVSQMAQAMRLRDVRHRAVGEDMMITGYPMGEG